VSRRHPFEQLKDRANSNLIGFLRTELDLGFTLADTAKIEAGMQNREHYERARKFAEAAVETVHRFESRIVEPKIRRELQERADQLTKLLSLMR